MNRRSLLGLTLGGSVALSLGTVRAAPEGSPPKEGGAKGAARPPRFGDGRDWFFQKRFGMFVHWGLYSIPGWHEQHQWRAKVPRAEYVKLQQQWNPVAFDPAQWLDLMQEAGMEYICLTTKHHDGFCLWETKLTPFHTVNTPYKRDIVGLLAAECRKRKVPLCLYYSIADWNHPAYPNEGRHHELPGPEAGDRPDWARYVEFVKGQVRELCTNYGPIGGIWWDMNVPKHQDPSINAMIRQLQPAAVINDRGFDGGDYGTPERDYAADAARAFGKRVEACQAVGSESWGFRQDEDYFTIGHLLRSIDRYRCRDANYLLNVGPTSAGRIDDRSAAILRSIGRWTKSVRESFDEAEPASHLTSNQKVMLTRKDRTLYVHLNQPLETDAVKLKPFLVAPKSAVLLNDGRALETSTALCPADHESGVAWLRIRGIPSDELANSVPVVRLDFDRPIEECLQKAPGPKTSDERIR